MKRELPHLPCGHIGQGSTLGSHDAVSTYLNVGLLHLPRAVAQYVLALLKVLGSLLALIGVIALPSYEAEDVAPPCWRAVDVDAEVCALVAVAEGVIKLCPVLGVFIVVAFRCCHCPSVLGVPQCLHVECHSTYHLLACASKFHYSTQVVRIVVLLLVGSVVTAGIAV